MKVKRISRYILIGICLISAFALLILLLTGCSTELEKESQTLSCYEIEVDYNNSLKTLTCTETINYINSSDTTLKYLALHLYPNAFREESISPPVNLANQHKAYPNGLSYGDITINTVSVLHNTATYGDKINITQPTSCEIEDFIETQKLIEPVYFIGGEDKNILYVIFPTSLYPDDRILIDINFSVKLPNINHRFGYGENTINLANFYPIACVYNNGEFDTSLYHHNGDPFYSDMANYKVTLKSSAELVISHSGSMLSQNQETITEQQQNLNESGEETLSNVTITKNITKLEALCVRDFAMVLSQEFKVVSQLVGDTEVKYYYFADTTPELSLETSVKSLLTFNELIGVYPYKTLSVVEANFVHGGMEFPNLVYISNEVIGDAYQQVIIHEIAHQWWYNMVGNSEISYAWLDEGLTEYTTALFYELHPEYNISKDTLISNAYNNYTLFLQVYTSVFGDVDTSMNRDLNEFSNENEYVYMTYVKGMLLFDSLREVLGYDKFVKCLQEYFKEYQYQNVTPENLIASFEKTSNVQLETYFQAWINGDVIIVN